MTTCDNCGRITEDKDEILCRACKPALARAAEIKKLHGEIAGAYWRFTRRANALPPSLAVPHAYDRLKELGEL